jgi:hypothetical protein
MSAAHNVHFWITLLVRCVLIAGEGGVAANQAGQVVCAA